MLNLQFPTDTKFEIGGLEYKYENHSDKYTFGHFGRFLPGTRSLILMEAFDVFKSPTSENKYQIRHHYYNSSNQWTSDTVWFTLAEIRKNGLHDLLENWPIF